MFWTSRPIIKIFCEILKSLKSAGSLYNNQYKKIKGLRRIPGVLYDL